MPKLFKRIEREDPLFEELVDAHARMISFGFAGILSTIFGAIGVFSPQPVGIALEIISVAGICVTASVIVCRV